MTKGERLGLAPFIWLAYSLPFVYWLFLVDGIWRWSGILGYICFLLLYFHGFRSKAYWITLNMAGLMTLGMIFTPQTSLAFCFFIYAAAFLGHYPSVRLAYLGLALILMMICGFVWLVGLAWWNAFIPAAISAVVAIPNIQHAERDRMQNSLIRAQNEIEALTKSEERERIARDLHDVLGHTLSSIVIKAQLAKKMTASKPEEAAKELVDIENIARSALEETRTAIRGYQNRSLREECAHAKRILTSAKIRADLHLPDDFPSGKLNRELTLILREAVTNILRHSQAKHCEIELEKTRKGWLLRIQDYQEPVEILEGSGLTNMKKRVEELNGEFRLTLKDGVQILIKVPEYT